MGAVQKMDVSVNIAQNFSDTQKAQARTNIGAAAASDLSNKMDKVSGATAGDVATLDENGNLVDSGKTLGTSVPADATFTDDKVAQMKADSSDTAYPLLMAGTTDPRGNATVTRYDSGVTLDPSTNTIAANISGNAATASEAASGSTLESKINSKQEAITWMTDAEALQLWTDAWNAAT